MSNINVKQQGRVVCIRLNRPDVLNALDTETIDQLLETVTQYDQRDDVGCFVFYGAGKAFCAGADIKELEQKTAADMMREDYFSAWESFTRCRTPKLAAVHGYALGGGCELAMMCDLICAADDAVFGQPEIKLGVIPGMGGSQRLTRLVGRALAMDMVLTGRTLQGEEARQAGLVSRVFERAELMTETLTVAHAIANFGKTACIAACEAVNNVDQLSLRDGLQAERRSYHTLWNTDDQTVGMQAFLSKSKPVFNQGVS